MKTNIEVNQKHHPANFWVSIDSEDTPSRLARVALCSECQQHALEQSRGRRSTIGVSNEIKVAWAKAHKKSMETPEMQAIIREYRFRIAAARCVEWMLLKVMRGLKWIDGYVIWANTVCDENSSANVKVMAHPLAGANLDRGVEVEIRWKQGK